jgi:putative MATE family efflux protein
MARTVCGSVLLLLAVGPALGARPLPGRPRPRILHTPLGASSAAEPPSAAAIPALPPAASARELNCDFVAIAMPSLAALSCENLLSLVDTMWLGRLGAEQMGAAGVGISATYSYAKLFDDPLVKTTTSLVAGKEGSELRASVLSAMALALLLGLAQLVAFSLLAGPIVGGFGVGAESAMREPAVAYVRLRALGAPAVTMLLVAQGIFRGLGDTLTPLLCTVAGNVVNFVLDPFLIFTCGLGCAGAAGATAIANYITIAPLLLLLRRRLIAAGGGAVGGDAIARASERAAILAALRSYLGAGSLVYVRTIGKLWGYGYASRRAAELGPVPAAAYALTFQLGVVTTQLCEAVSLAMQSLLSRELTRTERALALGAEGGTDSVANAAARGTSARESRAGTAAEFARNARHVVALGVGLGGGLAALLSVLTWLARSSAVRTLTSNVPVGALCVLVMPAVLICQCSKGLAYPANAVLMGGRDWLVSTAGMWASSGALVGSLLLWLPAPPAEGVATAAEGAAALLVIWRALGLTFAVQVAVSLLRYFSGTGPWRVLTGKGAPRDGDGRKAR